MSDEIGDKTVLTLTEHDTENIQHALSEFNKKNYSASLQFLNKLDNLSNDYRYLHNKAVLEYYKSDLKKTNAFRKALNALFAKFSVRSDAIEDTDHATSQYNLAVLLYHQTKYDQSLKIVNRLYAFIEPMEDELAHKVFLLLVELHLATHQYEKAIHLIAFIEEQTQNQTAAPSSAEKEIKILKRDAKDVKYQVRVISSLATFHEKLHYLRARCNLKLRNMKLARALIKDIISSKNQTPASICLRANFEYLKGNYKGAAKVLHSLIQNSLEVKSHGESTTVMYNNNMGILLYSQGKFNLALHYFRLAYDENEKHNTNMPRALESDNNFAQPLFTLGNSKKHEILYNIGVNFLLMGKPRQAFDCLIVALQRYHKNPRLWFRLAECCIQAHKSSNQVDFDVPMNEILQKVESGCFKKYILASQLSKDHKYSIESQSYAVPMPTLEFATLCLTNALNLLSVNKSSSDSASTSTSNVEKANSTTNSDGGPSFNMAPSPCIRSEEINALYNAILAALAYVTLCLGDYYMAMKHAKKLLSQSSLSDQHRLLGNLYAAEAMILMNQNFNEAIEYLNINNLKDINITNDGSAKLEKGKDADDFPETNTKPKIKWFPRTNETAFVILKYNLAVAYAISRDFEKAGDLLKDVWKSRSATTQVPAHVMMLVLYVQIQLGNTELTLQLVRQNCR